MWHKNTMFKACYTNFVLQYQQISYYDHRYINTFTCKVGKYCTQFRIHTLELPKRLRQISFQCLDNITRQQSYYTLSILLKKVQLPLKQQCLSFKEETFVKESVSPESFKILFSAHLNVRLY